MSASFLLLTVDHAEVDVATAPSMIDDLCSGMTAAGRYDAVIDLSIVTFMDSSGIGGLIHVNNFAEEHGGNVRLTEVQPQPARALHLAGLSQVLPTITLD